MKILFATGHLPSMKVSQAGARTSYGFCRFYAGSHEIHLAAFATAGELAVFDENEMAIFASWKIFPVSRFTRIRGILQELDLPLPIGARKSRVFERYIRQLQTQHHFDVVILDHTALFQFAELFPHSTITVGCAHDVLTQSWERRESVLGGGLKRNLVGWERRRIQRWEDQSFRSLGLLVVHSLKDKRYVESRFSPRREPSVINPWIHRTSLVQDATGLRKIPNTLLFWGAMDRQENIDAAIWIAKEIHPLIRRKVPNAIFYIAGNRSEKLKAQLAGCKGVILTGFVDDISALMRSMEIAMLPLRLGAGIKIKTLECMDAGIPVITTEVGAEGIDGIDGREFVIGATARDLAEAGVELLLDKERARAIGVAGQRIICQRYNFEGKLKELESRLYEIASS